MSFGKRPQKELYDINADPDCVNNLANNPDHSGTKAALWKQLTAELTTQGDPRILGKGEIFDFYPYCKVDRQQKLYKRPDFDPVKTFAEMFGEKPSTPGGK